MAAWRLKLRASGAKPVLPCSTTAPSTFTLICEVRGGGFGGSELAGSPHPGERGWGGWRTGMLTRLAAVTSLHASPCGATKKCSCSLLTRSCARENFLIPT